MRALVRKIRDWWTGPPPPPVQYIDIEEAARLYGGNVTDLLWRMETERIPHRGRGLQATFDPMDLARHRAKILARAEAVQQAERARQQQAAPPLAFLLRSDGRMQPVGASQGTAQVAETERAGQKPPWLRGTWEP